MPKTAEQERALTEYADALGEHVLRVMEARENTDTGFQEALKESFERLDNWRKRLQELGITPLL